MVLSLSARRAWIEISSACPKKIGRLVALRKESVDRNSTYVTRLPRAQVALRKESVDRNKRLGLLGWLRTLSLSARRAWIEIFGGAFGRLLALLSLSARRAWIEMCLVSLNYKEVLVALRKESVDRNDVIRPAIDVFLAVALRKESVDRNSTEPANMKAYITSLSARRAWIEITALNNINSSVNSRSPQGERG